MPDTARRAGQLNKKNKSARKDAETQRIRKDFSREAAMLIVTKLHHKDTKGAAQQSHNLTGAVKKIFADGMKLSRNFHWFYFREFHSVRQKISANLRPETLLKKQSLQVCITKFFLRGLKNFGHNNLTVESFCHQITLPLNFQSSILSLNAFANNATCATTRHAFLCGPFASLRLCVKAFCTEFTLQRLKNKRYLKYAKVTKHEKSNDQTHAKYPMGPKNLLGFFRKQFGQYHIKTKGHPKGLKRR
jgi:hypothetical protein